MRTPRSLMLAVIAIAATACEGTPPPAPPEKEPAPDTALHAPIEKARAVEDQVLEASREQDAAIEEQGG